MTKDTDTVETDEATVETDEATVETDEAAVDPTVDNRSDGAIVAARSADVDETETDEHVKIFVLPPGPNPTKGEGHDHEPNYAAVRQYMISQGLRPTGDVYHVSTKSCGPGGLSWALTYAVPAVPAERFDFTEVRVIQDATEGKASKPTE